ncbi:MAG: hypothetical protein ACM3PS_01925 [Syntrophothermus sp.]
MILAAKINSCQCLALDQFALPIFPGFPGSGTPFMIACTIQLSTQQIVQVQAASWIRFLFGPHFKEARIGCFINDRAYRYLKELPFSGLNFYPVGIFLR